MSIIFTTDASLYQEFTGLSFSSDIPATYEGLQTVLQGEGCSPSSPEIALTIEMPCGEKYEFPSLWDFPLHDTPCACGDTRHWVIRWESRIYSIEETLERRHV